MLFYVLLAAVNIACFVPLYVLNFRDAPNPLAFLSMIVRDRRRLTFLYAKRNFTDPFRVNFDFTFLILAAAAVGYSSDWLVFFLALVLAVGFVEIQYATIMRSVFKRAPSIRADVALLRSGIAIFQKQLYWIIPITVASFVAIVIASYEVTAWLFDLMPEDTGLPLVAALLLLPPCFYHWRSFAHSDFLARTVYSPTLHFVRNLELSSRLATALAKDGSYFECHNHFKDITLRDSPNVVIICVESYGSILYRDERYAREVRDLVRAYESRLIDAGYGFASTSSEAPIFAGGSWVSYASFTYGFNFADAQLFDALFAHRHAFAAYESLFHVLKRNGYYNLLLGPLAGVDKRTVDWAMIQRCFQSDRIIDFDSLDYRGRCVPFFGRLFAPPDQYSLNFAYESARERESRPFSLFFCTLNSHMPWDSPDVAVPDWRTLNDANRPFLASAQRRPTADRYLDAIRYQLDYILRFALDQAEDKPLIIVFGDHQPPLITPEQMGKRTPVHVLSDNRKLLEVLTAHGFHSTIDLTGIDAGPMRHEGFLSLFMRALNAAYGRNAGLEIDYRANGVPLFDEVAADV